MFLQMAQYPELSFEFINDFNNEKQQIYDDIKEWKKYTFLTEIIDPNAKVVHVSKLYLRQCN